MVKHAVILLGLASASACLSADYSAADAGVCLDDGTCPDGLVCVVGYCAPSEPASDSGPATDSGAAARCGDGIVQGENGETCDDGNTNLGDGCSDACLTEGCGNGRIDMGEACDDGNQDQTDACLNNCVAASCGDGHVQASVEACDDGNQEGFDACSAECDQVARCGDGIVRMDLSDGENGYEACDDGNQVQTDACLNDCSAAFCGDGIVRNDLNPGDEGYEACDDANTENDDDCDTSCRVLAGPGETQATASRDCQTLKARLPGLRDGVYWINPDQGDTNNAFRALCNMSVENSGWTQVVNMANGAETWDAWSEDVNLEDARHDDRNFGIRMRAFSDSPEGTGEDLEFFFMNGVDLRGPIYTGVHKKAWDPNQTEGNFDTSFSYRQIEWNAWSVCNQLIGRDNHKWSWSIAKGGAPGSNCADYRAGGGFMIEGGDSNPNQALILNGLGLFQNTRDFLLRIYVRRRPQ